MTNFLRNIFKLASASFIAQAISVLLIPIISRIYLPEDFGVLQQFTSLFSIIVIFSMGSYQLSVVLPEKEKDATSIFLLCTLLISLSTLIIVSIVLLLSDQIALYLFDEPELSKYLYLLPLAVLLNGSFLLLNYWYTREKKFGVIAKGRIINTSIGKITQIGSGVLMKPIPLGLILGPIIGFSTSVFYMVCGFKEKSKKFKKKEIKDIKRIAIRYKKFPLFSVWSQLCNQISIHIPTFLLSYYFSTTIVGYYSMANMTIHIPMTLVGSAISQVFLQRANEEKILNGNSKKVVSEVHHLLLALGVLPIIILMIIGSDLFEIVFGANWSNSGTYAAILGPWILLVLIASPISTLYSIYEKQNVGLAFNILLLASRFFSLYIGALLGSPILCLTFFSITGVVFWTWNNFYLIRLAGISLKKEAHHMIKYILIGIVFGMPLLILRSITEKKLIIFLIAIILLLSYYGFLFLKDKEMKGQLKTFIKGE